MLPSDEESWILSKLLECTSLNSDTVEHFGRRALHLHKTLLTRWKGPRYRMVLCRYSYSARYCPKPPIFTESAVCSMTNKAWTCLKPVSDVAFSCWAPTSKSVDSYNTGVLQKCHCHSFAHFGWYGVWYLFKSTWLSAWFYGPFHTITQVNYVPTIYSINTQ